VVSKFQFDVIIGTDGRRHTLKGFKRKEFRGKLAIAITMNIINRNTKADARVEEISGVAYIFNQGFFQDLKEATGIDLENIVYYKDETHYFVMTAKKKSLLLKGVLKKVLAGFLIETDCPSKYVRDASSILVLSPKTGGGGRYSLICKEGSRFSMWWCIEGALLPTLLRSLQRYYPNITFI
jgi:hypothetical protein